MNIESLFKLTYGMYVVSSSKSGKLNGYISNTVFQVTAEPPQVAVACNKNNLTADFIQSSKAFSISILEKDASPEIIGKFGYKSGKDINKFENSNYVISKNNIPLLLDNAIAIIECELVNIFDTGSHLLFIGKVIDGEIKDVGKEPLTYAYYREVRKGKSPKNAPTYIPPEVKQTEGNELPLKYVCPVCGYEYDENQGDPKNGIQPGTAYNNLPDNWVCPVCGAAKNKFISK